ncbi:MAG: hypothetical protein ACE5Q6_14225 [Dehalococcoidia bacterium]
MKSSKRRLDKIELHLTPRQAVLLWMEEAHQFGTLEEYAHHMKTQPDSAWPLRRLGDQMAASVERALKGKPKAEIWQTLRQADLDVLLLYYLHQQANGRMVDKNQYFWSHSLMLVKQLSALMREQTYHEQGLWNRMCVGLRLPYPLDADTADAVDAAIAHWILPWQMLAEGDELDRWITDHYLAEGKTALPDGAYRLLYSKFTLSGSTPDADEVAALFDNKSSFENFLACDDYSYGLADVTDEEYLAHHKALLKAMKDLDLEGLLAELPTVPHAFLRETPLIDGQWIDRYVVELAEWGARLVQQSMVIEEPEDSHALAWYRVLNREQETEADSETRSKLWQQTRKHLDRFPGRTREIGGRLYLKWEDYLGWRARWVKGDLKSGLSSGLVAYRWNQWIQNQGGEGIPTLNGVKVCKLSCYAGGYQYQVYPSAEELERQEQQRKSLLDSLLVNQPGSKSEERFHERVVWWRDLARRFLVDLYTLRQVIDTINHRYYDGQQVLFPEVGHSFAELVGYVENLVSLYNRSIAEDLDRLATMSPENDSQKSGEGFILDPTGLLDSIAEPARDQAAYLVDMAKVEALDTMDENQKAVEILDRHV